MENKTQRLLCEWKSISQPRSAQSLFWQGVCPWPWANHRRLLTQEALQRCTRPTEQHVPSSSGLGDSRGSCGSPGEFMIHPQTSRYPPPLPPSSHPKWSKLTPTISPAALCSQPPCAWGHVAHVHILTSMNATSPHTTDTTQKNIFDMSNLALEN